MSRLSLLGLPLGRDDVERLACHAVVTVERPFRDIVVG